MDFQIKVRIPELGKHLVAVGFPELTSLNLNKCHQKKHSNWYFNIIFVRSMWTFAGNFEGYLTKTTRIPLCPILHSKKPTQVRNTIQSQVLPGSCPISWEWTHDIYNLQGLKSETISQIAICFLMFFASISPKFLRSNFGSSVRKLKHLDM